MAELRCPNCGSINREGAKFCNKCGTVLPAQAPRTVLAEEVPPPTGPLPPATPGPDIPAYQPAVRPAPAAKPAGQSGSGSWLRTSTNLAAVVFGILFVFLIAFALPVLDVSNDLLEGEQYKAALRDQDIYNRFPDLFAEQMQLSQTSLGQEARIDFTGVTAADWKLIAQQLVTPQWMQAQVESLIDQTFASAESGASPPALNISLAEVNQRLSGDAGFNIYKQIIATKRSCSLDDFFNILDWIGQEPSVRLPICNIPPDLTEFAAWIAGYETGDELIKDLLKELPEAIPAQISLSDFFSLRMDRVAGWVGMLEVLAWICLLLALAALLATLISPFVRTLKGWLLTWGICLAAAGMVCLVISQLLPYSLGGLIVGAFSGSITPSLAKIILETGSSVTTEGATALTWQSLGMLTVGMAMAGTGALVWGIEKFRT